MKVKKCPDCGRVNVYVDDNEIISCSNCNRKYSADLPDEVDDEIMEEA